MGPILPVNVNSPMGASLLRSTQAVSAGQVPSEAAESPVTSVGMTSGTATAMSIVSEVSQLLESIGGDIKNDNLLRMMIALLILMALLQETQDQGQSRGQSLGLGNSADSGQLAFFEMSTTTISIEQTSFTAVAYGGADALGSTGEDTREPGSQIDLSI